MKSILYSIILSICSVVFLFAADPPLTPEQEISQNCGLTITDLDISASGTFVGDGDDVGFPVTLPFSFPFPGGIMVTDIAVSSNGYISSDPADAGPDLSNDCPLPSTVSSGSGGRLYPLHDDLDLESGIGAIFTESIAVPHPNGVTATSFVIYYDNIAHFPGGAGAPVWDMAVVLWDNGDFAYVYGSGNTEDGLSSTTGVLNDVPMDLGLDFIPCNTDGQGFGTALESICVLNPPPPPVDVVEVIPTMGEWGLICLMLILMSVGIIAIRRENVSTSLS